MSDNNAFAIGEIQPGLTGPYFKLGVAILVGVALAVGIYLFALKGDLLASNPVPIPDMCVCPKCGTRVQKPLGVDCEEIHCPNCGHSMVRAAALAPVAPTAPTTQPFTQYNRDTTPAQRIITAAAPTQNQRETLAEQGIVAPGPLTQNQRETLAEQGIAVPGNPAAAASLPRAVQVAAVDPNVTNNAPGVCVCPHCGKLIYRNAGVSCSQITCPNCGAPLTNAIIIGNPQNAATNGRVDPQSVNSGALAAAFGGGMHHNNNGALWNLHHPYPGGAYPQPMNTPGAAYQTGPGTSGGMYQPGVGADMNMNSPQAGVGVSPYAGGDATQAVPGMAMLAGGAGPTTQPITYSNTVQGIVQNNCLRCHGGPIRNLSTYNNLKAYADSGLLIMMTQPGGPMSRFLTSAESYQISAWVKGGSPL